MPLFKSDRFVSQFTEVTGSTTAVAKQYHDKYKSVDDAIQAYFDDSHCKKKFKPSREAASLFDTYRDPEHPEQIGIDGTLAMLGDLAIEPEDPRALMLAYLLASPQMGVFTKHEFLEAVTAAQVSSLAELKKHVDGYAAQVARDPAEFKRLYAYTFGFLMEVPNQKLLAGDTACDYWRLLWPLVVTDPAALARLDQWYTFVTTEWRRSLSRDTWVMFGAFFTEVVAADPATFAGYDEMAAWPAVVDEYVEYLRENGLLE
ncbi:defective in cullin neddylation protein 1 [Diutina catenulata]